MAVPGGSAATAIAPSSTWTSVRSSRELLGLQVDLQEVNLDITAVPGAGNLLGNLLCAVAGLLDGPGNPVNAITNLLNRLLGGLGLAA